MRRLIPLIMVLFICTNCRKESNILHSGNEFTLYTDNVVQGNYQAIAVSRTNLVSSYVSKASENYSRLIPFKFSINEKDNEMIPGKNHWVLIDKENVSPVIKFGESEGEAPDDKGLKLPVNYSYTFRLDMRKVLEQFDKTGYFETSDGSRIAKSDFKGVFIAGGARPLTWDFSNLEENNLKLKDENQDGIFEISLVLNPFDPEQNKKKEWLLSANLSAKPSYHSGQIIVDALFNLALEEALMNIEEDSTLRTGAKWGGVWTRDVSYSTLLAFAFHEPDVAKISLRKKVQRKRIIQDTGSGGAWPVSSDRTTWALAAWEIYKVTGEQEWLEYSYEVIKNTLDDDYKTLTSQKTGMYKGESSFLDWREQTYPKWMSNKDIFVSENLGTNVVHYQAHIILAKMAELLNKPFEEYLKRAEQIKKGINNFLWLEDKGYYAQYLYGRNNLIPSPSFEALGEALAVLFEVADTKKSESILSRSPVTEYGTSCIYPQIPGIPPYHNNGIWPFVQSFWNLAAAKTGNGKMLEHGLAAIYRPAALFLSNYENFVADNGDYIGTEINSHRMLWSIAGNLAMVHRVFMGMSFEPHGINFQPVIPDNYTGVKSLKGFKYRKAILDISVTGTGNQIKKFLVDGKSQKPAFISSLTKGAHSIEIIMANNTINTSPVNIVPNKFAPSTPLVHQHMETLEWEEAERAETYIIFKNGVQLKETRKRKFDLEEDSYGEYSVMAISPEGLPSFISEPVNITKPGNEIIIETEKFAKQSQVPATNFSGKGFIKTSPSENPNLLIPLQLKKSGSYLLDIRYSNGTGPWNTDNNCAIRSIYINQQYEGVLVFPQRGLGEWSDWGYTNTVEANLNKGENLITLAFNDWNNNMDGFINEALIDYIRIIEK